jgi:Tautomerase enzyme
MPFVDISLAQGKSREYLEGVSNAVHEALVAEFGIQPGDRFQLIQQHEPNDMIFDRSSLSDDFIVLTISDDLDRGELAKRRFYKNAGQTAPGRPDAEARGRVRHDPRDFPGQLLLRGRSGR